MKSPVVSVLIFLFNVSILFFATGYSLAQDSDDTRIESSPSKNYYLKSASSHFEQGEYGKAIEELGLALLLEPDNKDARVLLEKSRRLAEGQESLTGIQEQVDTSESTSSLYSVANGRLSSMEKVHIAVKEKQYDTAAEILDILLEIDPTNEEALYMKGRINTILYELTSEYLRTTKTQERLKSIENIEESSIPYQDTMRFPKRKDWEDISTRTLPESGKIVEENRAKTEQLRVVPNPVQNQFSKEIEDALNTIISFEFIETPLKDVITFIREKTQVNMIIDSDEGGRAITLKLKDVAVRTALKYILPKGYNYIIEENIIHIYQQKMELIVYDVRDILINFDDKEPFTFDITAAATAAASGASAVGGGGVSVSRSPFERVTDLVKMIVETIEPSTWSASGGEGTINSRIDQPGDLVVVNSTYVHKQIEDLLASFRSTQNLQVSIEARFITVSDEFLEDIGSNITEFFQEGTTIDTGASNVASDSSGGLITSGEGIFLDYTLFDDFEGFLRAVQEDKDSEILTSPRITLSNTQRGNIAVIRTENYVRSTTVEDGVVTPEIGTVPEGTTFDVRPVVSADRKYVYLEVTPSVFQIEDIEEFKFSNFDDFDGSLGGGDGTTYIPPQQTIELPIVNVSQVSVTVCVPDKGTLMIGGLGSVDNNETTTSVPILSKIPILKFLFTRNQKTRKKRNLIILIKPTIIIREEQERLFTHSRNRHQASGINREN